MDWSDHQATPVKLVTKPAEMPACWDFFTIEALLELLADVSYELGKRGQAIQVTA
jgi:hypothetical protein